jgi:hypothetical protein
MFLIKPSQITRATSSQANEEEQDTENKKRHNDKQCVQIGV